MKKPSPLLTALLTVLLLTGCAAEPTPPAADTTVPQTTAPEAVPDTVLAADGKAIYTIIRADETEQRTIEACAAFKMTLDASTKIDFPFMTDFYNKWMEEPVFPDPEILIGETNRPETAEVLAALPANSYTITQRGNKLVIVGTEPNLTEMALQRFTETILQNPNQCSEGRLVFTEADEITITFDVSHTIVRGEAEAINVVDSVEAFKQKLSASAKTNFPLRSDADAAETSSPAILVGETNRPETAEVLAALPANSYTVSLQGNNIVIVGTEPNLTVLALQRFAETILQSPDRYIDGKLVFTEADTFTVTLDAAPGLSALLNSGLTVTATSKRVIDCPGYSDEIRVGQGAASDGTYVYFVIRHVDDRGAVIYKHRLDNGERVGQSDIIQVGHGNDATFDTANNRLIVAHGQAQGKMLTIINPDTLAVEKVIDIPAGSGAISYSTAKNRYAISQGGSTLHILDADFNLLKSYSRKKNTGYTAQGMGSDEDYVYFPMSGGRDNILEVYNWNGSFVTTIHIDQSIESESMFWVNGTYYVSYNRGSASLSAQLHRIDFRITYGG